MKYQHEDNGALQECWQCKKQESLSFTACCGMLVCDNCRDSHTDDDCKIYPDGAERK